MPTTYNAVAANFVLANPYAVSQPNDLEDITAASEGAEHQNHADAIEFFRQHAGILNDARTWTAIQTFSAQITTNGPTGDESATRGFGGTITTRKLVDNLAGSSANARTYVTNNGELELVTNAVWHSTGGNANKWTQDNAAVASSRFKWSHASQAWKWETVAAGSAAWLDASWVVMQGIDLNGDSSLLRDFLAGRDVTATRNLVGVGAKAQRSYSTGAALAGSDFAISAGWGATATKTVSAGSTDARGEIAILAQGGTYAANPTITLTFKDGAWPSTPFGFWYIIGDATLLSWGMTTTTAVLTFKGTPAGGTTYTLGWVVSGY